MSPSVLGPTALAQVPVIAFPLHLAVNVIRFGTFVVTLLALVTGSALAQAPASNGPLRVFLDCDSRFCDFDFLRTEIPWIDYVRSRQDADLHVLVTSQGTGGGGTELTLAFLGQRGFSG